MILLCPLFFGLGFVSVHDQAEPEVDKNSISVHTVQRGNMPLRLMAQGEVISVNPPRVRVEVTAGAEPAPQVGQRASIQIHAPAVMTGVVTEVDGSGVIIGLKGAFPAGTAAGTKTGSLIDAGEAKNVVYFERPANSTTDAEMSLFVMEAGGEFANRTAVRFGRQSGSLIEIVSGLEAGDKVIVTDTTQWNSHERIRIK